MSDAAALQILICVRAVRPLDGAMAEAGVLKGGSARLICEAKGDAPLHLFDIFDMLQHQVVPAGAREVAEHFGSVHGVRQDVEQLLAPFANVHFHSGIFPASIPKALEAAHFSFVHIDLDLPRSITDALSFFHPRMVAGGIVLVDDADDDDVRTAIEVHFAKLNDTILDLPWGQVMIVKQG